MTLKRKLIVGALTVTVVSAAAYLSPGPLSGIYRSEPVCGDAAYLAVRDGRLQMISMCDHKVIGYGGIDTDQLPPRLPFSDGGSVLLRPRLLYLDTTWIDSGGGSKTYRSWRRWLPITDLHSYPVTLRIEAEQGEAD
jgi:hypothetical protein